MFCRQIGVAEFSEGDQPGEVDLHGINVGPFLVLPTLGSPGPLLCLLRLEVMLRGLRD